MKVKVLADYFQAIAPSADGLADRLVAVTALEQLCQRRSCGVLFPVSDLFRNPPVEPLPELRNEEVASK